MYPNVFTPHLVYVCSRLRMYYVVHYTYIYIYIYIYIGPADCKQYNCNHILLSESNTFQHNSVQVLNQFAVVVAVVTVRWSYEDCEDARGLRAQNPLESQNYF